MMMPHPLLPVGLPPASVAMAMNQMNHLNTIANMVASAQVHSPVSRPTSAIKVGHAVHTKHTHTNIYSFAARSSGIVHTVLA